MSAHKKSAKSKECYLNGKAHKKIDWNKVDELLKAQCHGTEIAAILGVSEDTLYNHCFFEHNVNWNQYKNPPKDAGKGLVKYEQYKEARSGNVQMMIFWGKNHLGQRDKFDHNIQGNISINHIHYSDEEEKQRWEENNNCEFRS